MDNPQRMVTLCAAVIKANERLFQTKLDYEDLQVIIIPISPVKDENGMWGNTFGRKYTNWN
jgi:hypothetical protein